LPWEVVLASVPYALLCTTVLMGKHIDKIAADGPMGIRTLPVILGERNARLLNSALMIGFYPIVLGAAAVGWIGPWVAIVVLGLPRLWAVLKTYAAERPSQAPPGWVLWPLWYVSFAFIHTRRAGALLVIGLFLNIVLPVKLPWLAG
jgi:1,4-dihydroxy-2-naphthoate octaprenyltransferase